MRLAITSKTRRPALEVYVSSPGENAKRLHLTVQRGDQRLLKLGRAGSGNLAAKQKVEESWVGNRDNFEHDD